MPGRPKTQIRKDIHEERNNGRISKAGTKSSCTNCKVVGHNRRSCKEAPRSVTSSNDTPAASQGTQSVNSSGTGIAENHDTPGASRPRNNSGLGPAKKPAKRAASG